MKKIIFTLAIAVSAFTASYAQRPERGPVSPEQRAERYADRLKEKLALSDSQRTEVYNLELEKAKKQQELRSKRKEEAGKIAEARKDEMKENEDKLLKILSPEQKSKYEAFKAEGRERMKDRKDRRAPMRGERTPAAATQTN